MMDWRFIIMCQVSPHSYGLHGSLPLSSSVRKSTRTHTPKPKTTRAGGLCSWRVRKDSSGYPASARSHRSQIGRLPSAGREKRRHCGVFSRGFEPSRTQAKQKTTRWVVFVWWGWRGSNPRPLRCERSALTNWATSPRKRYFTVSGLKWQALFRCFAQVGFDCFEAGRLTLFIRDTLHLQYAAFRVRWRAARS